MPPMIRKPDGTYRPAIPGEAFRLDAMTADELLEMVRYRLYDQPATWGAGSPKADIRWLIENSERQSPGEDE